MKYATQKRLLKFGIRISRFETARGRFKPSVHVFRRYRAGRFSAEWHSIRGVRYLMVGIASPNHHRWWATTIYIYITR